MRTTDLTIVHRTHRFSHDDACEVSRVALGIGAARRIVIDLHEADESETSAFARLVQLRRSLLSTGRDLKLAGLRDQTEGLYEVNRLDTILPRQ